MTNDKLTRKTIKIGKVQVRIAWLGLGVAAAGVIVTAAIGIFSSDSKDATTAQGGVCGQVGRDNIVCNVQTELQTISAQDSTDDKFKAEIQRISQGPPSPNGPWPYVVFNTIDSHGIDIGLKVRAGPEPPDLQIGSASRREILWAECVTTNTFDPEPDTGAGPTWVQIHWPNKQPTTQYFQSSPTDEIRAYVYAGNVLPFKHNGNIPKC